MKKVRRPLFAAMHMHEHNQERRKRAQSYGPPNYDPITALGSDLIAYWDASRGETLSVLLTLVSSWVDLVAGYALVQTAPASKPSYSSSSFNGAPGITFDGVADTLACSDAALMAALPSGATPCEQWVLVSQEAPATDTTERCALAYGGSSLVTGRAVTRIVTSGVNRARSRTGTGAASANLSDVSVDLSGIHILRQTVGNTSTGLIIDGGNASPATVSAVPATTNTLLRAGATNASAPASFWQGQIAAILITKPLSADKAAALQAYLGKKIP